MSSATFRDGMTTLDEKHQAALAGQEKRLLEEQKAALAAQEKRLLQQQKQLLKEQKAALDKAVADQKREILESIGKGKHLKAH